MPTLAARTQIMPASPIRKLAPYAAKAREKGLHIFQLNIGQPDLVTPPAFLKAIEEANIHTLAYAPSEGYRSYRDKLAAYYNRSFEMKVAADDIMITTGGSEALLFAFLACFNPGEEIIVPEPLYANYLGFAAEMDCVITPLPTSLDDNFNLPAPEAFEAVITPRTRGILICNPANPTGKLYAESDLHKLRDIVKEHDLYLLSDEVYKEFVYEGATFRSVLTLEGIEENTIVVDSVSKRWSACGARIGNLITRNRELYAAALRFAQARLSPPTLGQVGAEALTELPESYYQEVLKEYRSRRDLVVDRLNAMPGVTCQRSLGAFYVLPRLPIDDCENFCQWLLESFEHKGSTVMLAPGSGFYRTPGAGKDEVRLAYVLQREELTRAMDALEAALQAYPGRTV